MRQAGVHARAERGASSVRHGALRDRVCASPAGPLVLLAPPVLWARGCGAAAVSQGGSPALHWKSWGCKLFTGLSFLSLSHGTLTIHMVTNDEEEVPCVTSQDSGLRSGLHPWFLWHTAD